MTLVWGCNGLTSLNPRVYIAGPGMNGCFCFNLEYEIHASDKLATDPHLLPAAAIGINRLKV